MNNIKCMINGLTIVPYANPIPICLYAPPICPKPNTQYTMSLELYVTLNEVRWDGIGLSRRRRRRHARTHVQSRARAGKKQK